MPHYHNGRSFLRNNKITVDELNMKYYLILSIMLLVTLVVLIVVLKD
jgi:hypothetical protein